MPHPSFLYSLSTRLHKPPPPRRFPRRPTPPPHPHPHPPLRASLPHPSPLKPPPSLLSTHSTPTLPPITPLLTPPPATFWTYAWPRLLLLLIAAVWGTNFPTVKLLQSAPHPVPLPLAAAARFSLAALFLLPPALHEQLHRRHPVPLSIYPTAILIGLCLTSGYLTQSVSLLTTTASKSAFLCSLSVIAVPLLERILHSFRLSPPPQKDHPLITWGAPVLAVLGVALLEMSSISGPVSGDFFALLQALFFAAGFIGNARAITSYPGLAITLSAVQLGTVGVASLLWAVGHSCHEAGAFAWPEWGIAVATPQNAAAVVYAGVVTTAVTVWLENIVLEKVSASELAVLLSTEPFWAAGFSAMVLGETFGVQACLGGALILAACLLNQAKGMDFGTGIDGLRETVGARFGHFARVVRNTLGKCGGASS